MKSVIMQPYFCPYIGYIQLIAAADIFVLLDDVNFIKKGWINRNQLVFNNQRKLFTIPLHSISQNNLIKDVKLADDFPRWKDKFFRSLHLWYGKEKYYDEGMELLENVFVKKFNSICDINFESIKFIAKQLRLNTKFVKSSELEVSPAKGAAKLINLSEALGCKEYINAPGGKNIYTHEMFSSCNISLFFLKPSLKKYSMPNWIPGLSILDAIMRVGFSHIKNELLPGFEIEPAKMELLNV